MTERQRMANLLFEYGEIPQDQWIIEGDIISAITFKTD